MDDNILEAVSKEVYKRFPAVSGSRPKVQNSAKSGEGNHVLVYRSNATTSDGKKISQIIRVTINDRGKILKISSSR